MKKEYLIDLILYEDRILDSEINYVKGDKNVYPIEITLLKANNIKFNVSENAIINAYVSKKFNTVKIVPCEIIGNGIIKMNVPEDLLHEIGNYTVEVKIDNNEDTEERLTFQKFNFTVLDSNNDVPETPPEIYSDWVQGINQEVSNVKSIVSESTEIVDGFDERIGNTEIAIDELNTEFNDLANDVISVTDNANNHISNNNIHTNETEKTTWNNKLDENSANPFFKDVTYDEENGLWTFTRNDNTVVTFDQPIEELITNAYYDEETMELVMVFHSGNEVRIPATGLIADFEGTETETIQVEISYDNIISAMIKGGSISKNLLAEVLREELDNKANIEYVNEQVALKDTLPTMVNYSVLGNSSGETGKPLNSIRYSATVLNSSLAMRTSTGVLRGATAVADTDLTPLSQVNELISEATQYIGTITNLDGTKTEMRLGSESEFENIDTTDMLMFSYED